MTIPMAVHTPARMGPSWLAEDYSLIRASSRSHKTVRLPRVTADRDDGVRRRPRTGVARLMHGAVRDVDHAPGARPLGPAVVDDFQRTFRHDDELGMLNRVRRAPLAARWLYRRVDVHALA